MKVALVYDRVNKFGGAERVLLTLHELYPDAPLYTLVYDKKHAPWAKSFKIITSFMQCIPLARRFHEFFPVLPIFAFEQFNFESFDVVISVTATEAKGIITSPKTLHICYCLTPTRFIWSHYDEYFHNKILRFFSKPVISWLRLWDQMAAQRPDKMVAISKVVAARITKYYHRRSSVIYPPVETKRFEFRPKTGDYFLVVARLVRYKRVDIAIEACNKLKLPLVIVGSGMDEQRLRNLSGPTIKFVGNLTDEKLTHYYQSCRALIFAQEEDFGLVAVEAMASGKPVIALAKGGAVETVIPGVTGELFFEQTSQALVSILEKFQDSKYSAHLCRQEARRFDQEKFAKNFKKYISHEWNMWQKKL